MMLAFVALAGGAFAESAPTDVWDGVDWIGGFNRLRAEFELPRVPNEGKLELLVTSLGCHEVTVNGQKVGDGLFEPGFSTVPSHRLLYNTHTISGLLPPGDVAASAVVVVGVQLGSCKYGWMQTYCADTAAKCVGLKLQVVAEGRRLLWTNATEVWRGSQSPWAASGHAYPQRTLWDGARYHHSAATPGWDRPGYAAARSWKPAQLIAPPIDPPLLSPSSLPPITKHPAAGLAPVDMWSPCPGVWVADFGTNMAGFATIRVPAGAGTMVIQALHGEILFEERGRVQNQYDSTLNNETGPHNPADCAHYGSCAHQTDVYSLDAAHEAMTLEPYGTYHGFRYVEITVSDVEITVSAAPAAESRAMAARAATPAWAPSVSDLRAYYLRNISMPTEILD
jgi:alpha-L-rhamnosidase